MHKRACKNRKKDVPLKCIRRDNALLEADQLNEMDTFDEVDDYNYIRMINGHFQHGNGAVELCPVQPHFYRVIMAWAFAEILILSYSLLKNAEKGYPKNFLNGLCYYDVCDHLIRRMAAYKIMTAILLAFGGFKVRQQLFRCLQNFQGSRKKKLGKLRKFLGQPKKKLGKLGKFLGEPKKKISILQFLSSRFQRFPMKFR